MNDRVDFAAHLLTAPAIREHCGEVAAMIASGGSPHFRWDGSRLDETAAYVARVIRERYPSLRVPYHSRWRHFEAQGVDRWAALAARHGLQDDRDERARARIDLVIPSVLLDAGAGPDWRYREAGGGEPLGRSEGLGVASLAMFARGAWSDRAGEPLRSDASALARVTAADVARDFQAASDNPLTGLEGRAALLARLGTIAQSRPDVFGSPARLGNLLDHWRGRAPHGRLDAQAVLATLLDVLGPIWPGRHAVGGRPLGDCWPHPAARGGMVPFHKLSQWLTYSLLEPLEDAGLEVTGLETLTGLPEYRNGGLLLDLGVLVPRDPTLPSRMLTVDDPVVVEWRAATVVGLDRLAPRVREALGVDAVAFPLARMLEGGTWAAGRRIAAERRRGGGPPLAIASDGTVF